MEVKKVIPKDKPAYRNFPLKEYQEVLDESFQDIHIFNGVDKKATFETPGALLFEYLVARRPTCVEAKESKDIVFGQCKSGAARSREDAYLLLRSVVPNLTFEKIELLFDKIMIEWRHCQQTHENMSRRSIAKSFCSSVRRDVYSVPMLQTVKKEYRDNFENLVNQYFNVNQSNKGGAPELEFVQESTTGSGPLPSLSNQGVRADNEKQTTDIPIGAELDGSSRDGILYNGGTSNLL